MGATAPTADGQAGRDMISAGLAVSRFLGKGDIAGHEFHGNQWTGGAGVDNAPQVASPAAHVAAAVGVSDRLDPHDLTRLNVDNAVALTSHYRSAELAKPEFDRTLQRIASEVGGTAITPRLKGSGRAVDKIVSDYRGDATRIKDVLRATIEVNSPQAAQAALAKMRASMGEEVGTMRNLLVPGSPTPKDGYRDIKANFRFGGITTEVQVSLPAMLDAKKAQHGAYAERSTIERRAFDQNRDLSGFELARVTALNQQMRAAYNGAWRSSGGEGP